MSFKLFKVKGIWHYRFQVARARVQRSTREKVKGRAEAAAQRAYDAAVVRTNGGNPVPTLAELIGEWQAVHYAPVISAAHARSVDTFARLHLHDLGDLPITAITTERVERARNEHLKTHRPASANHWMRILKLLVNWAVKRKIIMVLPWKVVPLKLQKRPRVILPVAVAAAWFAAIDKAAREPGAGVAVRLMLFLGLRESESTSACWDWIDWERATYTPGKTKGKEAEPLPMPAWLVDYLQPLRRDSGLIAAKKNGDSFPPGFARKAMLTANDSCKTRGITPHRLRGTIATLLSEAGVPIQTIQKFLRHKSPMTTMAYLEKNMDLAASAQNKITAQIGMVWRKSGEQQESVPTEACES
ncbi:MAG: site-specific integrase [Pseudomonadota bacterium]